MMQVLGERMYEEHLIIMNRNNFIQEVVQKYKLVNGVQEAASYSALPQKAVINNLCICVHVCVGCVYRGSAHVSMCVRVYIDSSGYLGVIAPQVWSTYF